MSTRSAQSPLHEFIRARVDRALAGWEAAASPARRASRETLRRFLDTLDQFGEAADALAIGEHAPAAPAVVLVVGGDGLTGDLEEWLEPHQRVQQVLSPELAFTTDEARLPDLLLVTTGSLAADVVHAIRDLKPGIPVLVLATEHEMAPLVGIFDDEPVLLMCAPADARQVALAVRALLAQVATARQAAPPNLGASRTLEPKSYAHLAGLLPRALEGVIDFDAGAAVIARPGSDPVVDAYGRSDVPAASLKRVRERALALFRLSSGGSLRREDLSVLSRPFPFPSSLHQPLASEGAIAGLTYLASSRRNAFTANDQRVLNALVTHASGAYRRLEGSVRRLRLTPRQSQILALIAAGLPDKAVADRLGLAHRTVRTHLDRLLREHGLHSRTEAVTAWLRGRQD